jgi:hypothetical protein
MRVSLYVSRRRAGARRPAAAKAQKYSKASDSRAIRIRRAAMNTR